MSSRGIIYLALDLIWIFLPCVALAALAALALTTQSRLDSNSEITLPLEC